MVPLEAVLRTLSTLKLQVFLPLSLEALGASTLICVPTVFEAAALVAKPVCHCLVQEVRHRLAVHKELDLALDNVRSCVADFVTAMSGLRGRDSRCQGLARCARFLGAVFEPLSSLGSQALPMPSPSVLTCFGFRAFTQLSERFLTPSKS